MPRKAAKTDKPALQFLERPVSGARLQNVPEVRAALNPREFFSKTHSSSALSSWVQPQFDISATPPFRRGRRNCQSVTRILDTCNELSRKHKVCKYPSLLFLRAERDKSHNPSGQRTKKGAEVTSMPEDQPQGSCQSKRTVLTAHKRRRNPQKSLNRAASHSEYLHQPENQLIEVTEESRTPPGGCSSPRLGNVDPPPEVDTPTMKQNSCPMSPPVCSLLADPSSPQCHLHPDVLVSDTPERDYGVKVTWRRRKGLMIILKERGLLD
uniref:Si:ch73-352p4.5 n=1 Tax=Oryzias latipes TaxID=8090 RepID=A0A3P9KLW4_ORYLA